MPHRHAVTTFMPSVAALTGLAPINGTSVMSLLSIAGSEKPVALTVTLPSAVVLTCLTYLVPEPAVTSQPQLSAATVSAVLGAVWIASVIVVRHDDAARITSDILAFFVY